MTFCVGVRVKEGLVGLADTRITTGTEVIKARKVAVFEAERRAMFIMTSGLRSVRDKVLTYFGEVWEEHHESYDRLFKAVNAFAEQLRTVAGEDREALKGSGLAFNLHALIGGQMEHDRTHRLFLLYPEGNWVEVGEGTPYQIIGSSRYGKPVLDRTIHFDDSPRMALKVSCLAFDSTRISSADVGFPIDVIHYARDSFRIRTQRFEKEDLESAAAWWQDRLRQSVEEMPSEWMETFLDGGGGGR